MIGTAFAGAWAKAGKARDRRQGAGRMRQTIQFAGIFTLALGVTAFMQQPKIGYDDTPMQPNGKWHIHDGKRPQPRVVAPGATLGAPPADATVLLGPGTDTSAWQMSNGSAITWPVKEGVLQSAKGMIETKAQFGDFQLHVEFATPKEVKGEGQGRGNSGVFLLGVFEIQVLDSYQNMTYPDGQAAAMYGQYPPLVNASRGPGEWQAYDIVFTAPRFDGSGKVEKPATVTVLHNGVVVHNATSFQGPTEHKMIGKYAPANSKGPIRLQDHGNPVHFRNIWIRQLKGYDET
jgi:Domain of Unknown Function (DUF1080)